MLSNIVHIPKRTDVDFTNYWVIYEESYKENKVIDKYNCSVKSEKQLYDFYEQVQDIKYNFYKKNYTDVENYLLSKYLSSYFDKYSQKLKDELDSFFKNGKLNDFIKITLYYLLKCDKSENKHLFDVYCKHINDKLDNINISNELDFVKFKYYFDKLLNEIKAIDHDDTLLNSIINKTSKSMIDIIIKLIEKNGTKYCKSLIEKTYFKNMFCNKKIIKYSTEDSLNKLIFFLINKTLVKINLKNSQNCDLANEIIYIYKILNNITFVNNNIILTEMSAYNDINNLVNYLSASIFYWFNKEQFWKVDELIKFQNLNPNNLEFLNYYKINLQKRSINSYSNYFYENKTYELLLKVFTFEDIKKQLDNIKNCLDDIYLSDYMNKELQNLKVSVESNKFQNTNFDLTKLKLFVCSNILWDDLKNKENTTKLILPENLDVYFTIFKKYYKAKYENRKIEISNSNSFVKIKLGNSICKMTILHFTILKMIANNNNCDLLFLKNKLKISEDIIEDYIEILKVNNLVFENNKNFSFNISILTDEICVNLIKDVKTNKEIEKKIEYDKDLLIDSHSVNFIKQNKKISYGRLLMLIRKSLSKYFIIEQNRLEKRLSRMEVLGYIKKDANTKTYYYIE